MIEVPVVQFSHSVLSLVVLFHLGSLTTLSAQPGWGHSYGDPGTGPPVEPGPSDPVLTQDWEASIADPTAQQIVVPPMDPVSWLGLDTPTTWAMLDFQNRQGDKQLYVLDSQGTQPCYPRAVVGAQLRASGLLATTNTPNSFSYLGRFPPDFNRQSATDLRLLHANQNLLVHAAPWASGYVETLFSDVFTFPTATQGSFQMRQAYAVLGNLNESPLYGFIGKKNVSFGDMRSLSPFSQSVVWHYFGGLAEGGGLGYSADGLNLTFTALNGSRGIRVVDSTRKGHLNNFAANGSYEFQMPSGIEVMFGGGYLHGTIYDGATAEHTNPNVVGPLNGAWDANGRIGFGPCVFSAEYVETLKAWPVTAHKVQAWRTEAAYEMPICQIPAWWTFSWSEGIQGRSGSEFEFNKQLVLGLELHPADNVLLTFEYVRSLGFAPLIDITTVSNRDVIQNSLVLGLVLAI